MDMDMAALNQLAGLNPIMLENFQFTDFSVENFLAHQQPEFPGSSTHNFLPSNFQADHMNAVPVLHGMPLTGDVCHPRKKRKVMEQSNTSSKIISSIAFGDGFEVNNDNKRKKRLGKGKNNEKEVKNSDEVIHVRARRGQATDSHSLAERVRRQKISNKLRRLQELVPGCYKTMGMAVMLDEIINYVHSLQNQVEFLSMELASATSSYDFNPETDAISRRTST